MPNPTSAWNMVPIWGAYFKADGITPVTGKIRLTFTSRVTRVDNRMIYPEGHTVERTIGDTTADAATRDAVRAAWRAADQAAQGGAFNGAAWDAWWNVWITGAVFAAAPAADDPDIDAVYYVDDDGTTRQGYKVKVEELLTSGSGKVYYVEPLLAQLDTVPPGINLGAYDVPPGAPSAPAPIYAKGLPGGVASLDQSGRVPFEQLPPGGAGGTTDAGALTGTLSPDRVADESLPLAKLDVAVATQDDLAAVDAAKVDTTSVGVAGGVAALDGSGKVPQDQIPSVALTEFLGAAASQAAMLALTGQTGDWATRTDLGTTWQLIGTPASSLASWQQLSYPASPVTTVFGRTGSVTGSKADVGLDQVANLSPAAMPVSAAQQAAIDAAKDRANHTGSHPASVISDLTEAVQDIVGAFFGAGTGASVTYNDAAGTLTVSATGSNDPEAIRDAIGTALIGVGNISVAVNDAGDTITISTTATANRTDTATDTAIANAVATGAPNATTGAPGKVQLAGALGGTATAPTAFGMSSLTQVTEAIQDTVAGLFANGTHDGVTFAYSDDTTPPRIDVVVTAPSGGGGFTPPAGSKILLATEDPAVAAAYPEYAWVILDPAPASGPPAISTDQLRGDWISEDLTVSGSTVTAWPNQVSGGPNMVITGAPVRSTADASGRPSVIFDGVDDYVSAALPNVARPVTRILIGRLVTSATGKTLMGTTNGTTNRLTLSTATSGGKWNTYGGANLTHSANYDTAKHFFSQAMDTTSSFAVDGVAVTGAGGTESVEGLRIGANPGLTTFANVEVFRVIDYARLVPDAELDEIRAAHATYYGLP